MSLFLFKALAVFCGIFCESVRGACLAFAAGRSIIFAFLAVFTLLGGELQGLIHDCCALNLSGIEATDSARLRLRA